MLQTCDEYGQTGGFDFRHPLNRLRCGRSGGQVAQQDPDIRCRAATRPEWGIVDFGLARSIGCIREKRRRRDIGRRGRRQWPAARGRLGGNGSLIPTSCHRLPLGNALFIIKIFFRGASGRPTGGWMEEPKNRLNTLKNICEHLDTRAENFFNHEIRNQNWESASLLRRLRAVGFRRVPSDNAGCAGLWGSRTRTVHRSGFRLAQRRSREKSAKPLAGILRTFLKYSSSAPFPGQGGGCCSDSTSQGIGYSSVNPINRGTGAQK